MQNTSRAGFTKVINVIVTVAAVAVAVLAVYYFTSDVGRTRIDAAGKQYAKWTPENIAKDPLNYLNFCETECNNAILSLKASEIEIAQKRGEIKRLSDNDKGAVKSGEKLLDSIKAGYSKAEEDGAFPFTVAALPGKSFDQDTARREIVNVHKQVESKKSAVMQTEAAMKQLDANLLRVQDGRSNLQQQLQEITTSRTTLKIATITDDLTKRLSSIGAAVQSTVGLAADSSAPINIDQFVTQQAGEVDEDEFAKIMAQ